MSLAFSPRYMGAPPLRPRPPFFFSSYINRQALILIAAFDTGIRI